MEAALGVVVLDEGGDVIEQVEGVGEGLRLYSGRRYLRVDDKDDGVAALDDQQLLRRRFQDVVLAWKVEDPQWDVLQLEVEVFHLAGLLQHERHLGVHLLEDHFGYAGLADLGQPHEADVHD